MGDASQEIAEGERYLSRLEYEEAFRRFEDAVRKDPDNAYAHFCQAEAALGLDDLKPEEIASLYKRAIELEPDNPHFLNAYGLFCIDVGRFKTAEEVFNRAAELDRENAPLYYADFAVNYYRQAPVVGGRYLDADTQRMIAKKSLEYLLKALDLSKEEARDLLGD